MFQILSVLTNFGCQFGWTWVWW